MQAPYRCQGISRAPGLNARYLDIDMAPAYSRRDFIRQDVIYARRLLRGTMKLRHFASGLLALSLLTVLPPVTRAEGIPLGNIAVTGAVLIDGQPASGTVAASNSVRISTGGDGSAVLTL